MHWWSLGAISVISLYVLIISILPLLLNITGETSRYLYIASITSSIGILVLSVFESGKSYMVKSERFVMCGRELAKLLRKLDIVLDKGNVKYEEIENLIKRYNNVLDKYAQNHERDDFDYFRANNDHFDLGCIEKNFYIIKWNLRIYWKPVLFCLIPPVLVFLAI